MKKNLSRRTAAFLCACVMSVTFMASAFSASAAGGTSSLSATSKNVTPSKISVKVQDADVRDLLSAIAVNMGYNIIYVASPQSVTIEMKDVKPDAAFEYLLRALDLQYIAEGKTLIVGERELLLNNFRTKLALAQFKLNYISASVLASQIQQLDLPVTIIQVPSNDKMLWVQGFSVDIGKINELIGLLDIPANASTTSGATGGKSLTYVTVSGGMTAYEFDRLLKTLGIDCGLCLSDDGSRLYVYATTEELSAINDILSKVSADGSYAALSNVNKSEILSVSNISKSAAIGAIRAACPELDIITVDNSSKAFLVMGSNDVIQRAKEVLAQLDVSTMNNVKNTVNVYQLQNITAAEAARRLSSVSFDDAVQVYASDYAEFSKSLYVYCNEFYWAQVQALIAKIDISDVNMYGTPVLVSDAASVAAMQNLLITVRGIQAAKLQTVNFGTDVVLYLTNADASDVAAVDEFISRLSSVSTGNTAVDVSWAAYQQYCTANGQTPTSDGYVAWVATQLGKSSGSSLPVAPGAQYSASPENVSPTPAPQTPQPTPTPAPTAAEKLEEAEGALKNMAAGYVASAATTPDDLLAAAKAAVAAQGLTDVNVEVNATRAVVYTLPTETETGLIGLPLYLTCEDNFFCFQVNVTLPVAAAPEA